MKLKRITRYSEETFRDLDALHRQLSFSGRGIAKTDLRAALKDRNVYCIGLFDGTRIIGTATLTVMHAIGEAKGHMDDVVVDEAYRGRGLGKKLVRHMIILAKKLRLTRMECTSRRSRVAANALYQKLGFELRDSNAYVIKFSAFPVLPRPPQASFSAL